jgi:hypothetical protein
MIPALNEAHNRERAALLANPNQGVCHPEQASCEPHKPWVREVDVNPDFFETRRRGPVPIGLKISRRSERRQTRSRIRLFRGYPAPNEARPEYRVQLSVVRRRGLPCQDRGRTILDRRRAGTHARKPQTTRARFPRVISLCQPVGLDCVRDGARLMGMLYMTAIVFCGVITVFRPGESLASRTRRRDVDQGSGEEGHDLHQ